MIRCGDGASEQQCLDELTVDGEGIMRKLVAVGVIAGVSLLSATPFSLRINKQSVSFVSDTASAAIGHPSTAEARRRMHRRSDDAPTYHGYRAYRPSGYYGYVSPPSQPYRYYGYGYGTSSYFFTSQPIYYGYGTPYRDYRNDPYRPYGYRSY